MPTGPAGSKEIRLACIKCGGFLFQMLPMGCFLDVHEKYMPWICETLQLVCVVSGWCCVAVLSAVCSSLLCFVRDSVSVSVFSKMMRSNVPDLTGSKNVLATNFCALPGVRTLGACPSDLCSNEKHFTWNLHQTRALFTSHTLKLLELSRLFQTWWKDLESRHISRAGQRWPVATILSPFSVLRLALRFPYNCYVGFWGI